MDFGNRSDLYSVCLIEVVSQRIVLELGVDINHLEGFVAFFARALRNAQTAAYAVAWRYLNAETQVGIFLAHQRQRSEFHRSVFYFFRCQREDTDCSMRADEGAESALNAVFRIPFRNFNGDGTFFVECSVVLHGSVKNTVFGEGGNRHVVAFEAVDASCIFIPVSVAGRLDGVRLQAGQTRLCLLQLQQVRSLPMSMAL